MSIADGIQPASARMNANGMPAAAGGQIASVLKSTRGSVSAAANSVDTARTMRIALIERSSSAELADLSRPRAEEDQERGHGPERQGEAEGVAGTGTT